MSNNTPFEIIQFVCGHDATTNPGWAEVDKEAYCPTCKKKQKIRKVVKDN